PHCGTCSSIQACWIGCSLPSLARPSSVVTSPLTFETGVMHDRVAAPLMITVHAPHCPRPQPNRGPCKPRSLRRMYSSGVEASISKVCGLPFTFNVMLLMNHSPYASHGVHCCVRLVVHYSKKSMKLPGINEERHSENYTGDDTKNWD